MAGGNLASQGSGGEAKFHAVPWAKRGDLGSKVLKKGPPSATYKAGSIVEMSWAIRYNRAANRACLRNLHASRDTARQRSPSGQPSLNLSLAVGLQMEGDISTACARRPSR
jgi:hypothetical protein